MKQAKTPRFDVVTIGAATRDVFVRSKKLERSPSKTAPDGLEALIPFGAKIGVDELVFETGGGATNAAVTFSRFGFKTACVARIGNDLGGKEIVNQLARERVDISQISTDAKIRTGYSIILLDGVGHRAILVSRGASQHLGSAKLDWSKLHSRWIYLTSLGGDEKLIKTIFVEAKKKLTHIAWNPGNAEIGLGLKKLLPYLMQTDVLVMNQEEAAELSECAPRHLECVFKTLGPIPREAFVVTDGSNGAYVHARGITWHAAALKGKILNTTGAGDAFGSAFVATLIKTGDLETALRSGTVNAFGVVSHMGAKAGILKHAPQPRDLKTVRVRQLN